MKNSPVTFKLKGIEYYWENITLMKKVGEGWESVNGMVDFGHSKQWFKDGLLHRDDGPAWIGNGDEIWYYEGKRHNASGPAYISGFRKELWLFGEKYLNENDWKIMSRKIKLEKLLA